MSLSRTAYFANGFAVGGMMEYVERFRAGSKDIHSCDIGKYVRFSDYQRVAFKFQEYFEAWNDLRRRNAVLEGMYKCACSEADSVLKDLRKCEAKNAELERELADIKESYSNVLAEPCESDDRVHCTCVPALRAEIKRLREALKNICSFFNENSFDFSYTIAKAALKEVDGGKETPRVG